MTIERGIYLLLAVIAAIIVLAFLARVLGVAF